MDRLPAGVHPALELVRARTRSPAIDGTTAEESLFGGELGRAAEKAVADARGPAG